VLMGMPPAVRGDLPAPDPSELSTAPEAEAETSKEDDKAE